MSQNSKTLTPLAQPSRFLSAYSEKTKVSMSFPEHSRWTKQSFAEECDINTIMARYMSTGELPAINLRAPEYLDVTGMDYQEAMQFTTEAQSLFNELPSAVRNRFDNDPAKFLDFTSNPENRKEMAQMGLLRDEVALSLLYPQPLKENPSEPQKSPPSSPN